MDLKPWLLTQHGKEFVLDDPKPDMVDIRDLAFHLARIRRFNGATEANCSVALHCVIASYMGPITQATNLFLHDAAEAYIGDIPGPLKWMLGNAINSVEYKILRVIYKHFNQPITALSNETTLDHIRRVDYELLGFEKYHFLPPSSDWEILKGVGYPNEAESWLAYYDIHDPAIHERLYLDRAAELGLG